MTFHFEGAILGIDHGLKFLGLARSWSGEFAEPLQVIPRQSKAEDFAKLKAIIERDSIKTIVLGLPPRPPEFEGFSQADKVRNWAGYLAAVIDLPIYLWDEGLTSEDAETALRDLGKPLPERVDAHAAAVMLQSCLDAVREDGAMPERFTLLGS